MSSDTLSDLERQVRLSKMLAMGFALSLAGVAGLGSLVAMLIGLKALIVISRSPIELAGRWIAWWCVIIGGIGAIYTLLYVLIQLVPLD